MNQDPRTERRSAPAPPESRGVRLGRIAGVTVTLDWSLLIIFALIPLMLSGGLLPVWHPDWGRLTILVTAGLAAVLFLASILAHELSHAVVGRRLGMRIERITSSCSGHGAPGGGAARPADRARHGDTRRPER